MYFFFFRYGNWANDTYTADKIAETYTHNNKVTYGSYENRSGGRDAILPLQYPLHSVLDTQHGAVFGSFGASGIEGKYSSEGAAREWSTVVIVIVIFIS